LGFGMGVCVSDNQWQEAWRGKYSSITKAHIPHISPPLLSCGSIAIYRSMIRRGIVSMLTGLLAIISVTAVSRADAPAEPPDFKEVYDLIRAHVAGLSQPQPDRAAVQALVAALAPKVMLVGEDTQANAASNAPPLSKTSVYEGEIAYL